MLILLMCNCTSSREKKIVKSSIKTDTVRKDIPHSLDGRLSLSYLLKDSAEKKAGFQTMENGFDSLKIRFWLGYVFSEKEQVIEIEFANNKWTGTLFNLTNEYGPNSDTIISVKREIKNVVPKSGWAKLTESLFNLDVLTLPSFETISKYTISTDASMINVQVAMKNIYRIYFYPSPSHNEDLPEGKKILKIMNLLQNELDFKLVRNI